MSQPTDQRPRTDAERLADHAAIGRLADDLLPALVAKLAASGLGEIEVREGEWHVRLRMPVVAPDRGTGRRAGAPVRTGGGGPGTVVHAGDPATSATAAHQATDTTGGRSRTPAPGAAPASAPASTSSSAAAAGTEADSAGDVPARPRAVATSPAVGIYRTGKGIAPGSRVRAGDRIGVVDVLGVPRDVLAPEDGIVGSSYVEDGEGVEYGQELVRIELSAEPARQEPAR